MSVNIKTENGLVQIAGKVNSFPVNKISNSDYLEDSPVGTVISFMGTTAPAHYLVCDGTIYNIADYSALADFFQSQFGSKNYFGGDGTTTFAVPDLRGEFLRGTGTNSHENQGSGANVGVHQDATTLPNLFQDGDGTFGTFGYWNKSAQTQTIENADTFISATTRERYLSNTNYSEEKLMNRAYTARPTNTSVLYCIKYESTYFMEVEDVGYSTSETFTGKTWIDGKPIYRKVIQNTTHSIESTYKNIVELNSDCEIIKFDGYAVYSDDTKLQKIPLNFSNSTNDYKIIAMVGDTKNSVKSMFLGYLYANLPLYIIVEYTKTTD